MLVMPAATSDGAHQDHSMPRAAASMRVMSALLTYKTAWELQGPEWRAEIMKRI